MFCPWAFYMLLMHQKSKIVQEHTGESPISGLASPAHQCQRHPAGKRTKKSRPFQTATNESRVLPDCLRGPMHRWQAVATWILGWYWWGRTFKQRERVLCTWSIQYYIKNTTLHTFASVTHLVYKKLDKNKVTTIPNVDVDRSAGVGFILVDWPGPFKGMYVASQDDVHPMLKEELLWWIDK